MFRSFFTLVILLFFILESKACGRGNDPTPETNKPVESDSGTPSPTTPCTPTPKCINYADVHNESLLVSRACAPILNGSCVNEMDWIIFRNLTDTYESELSIIANSIGRYDCNCRNRSVEILCRFLLPVCTIPGEQSCNASTCMQPQFEQPCSSYCENLTASCLSDNDTDDVNNVFANFGKNLTQMCSGLSDENCWNDTTDELSADCTVIPEITSMTMTESATSQSSSVTETTGTSKSGSDSSNNVNAEEQDNNTQLIIIIVASSIGGLILILIIVVVIRRSSLCHQATKVPPDNNEKSEKEVVYNSIYKSVELQAGSNYEDAGASNGTNLDALYTLIDKPRKTSPNDTSDNSDSAILEEQPYTKMKSVPPPNTSPTNVYSQVY